jgi:hypothetical protein
VTTLEQCVLATNTMQATSRRALCGQPMPQCAACNSTRSKLLHAPYELFMRCVTACSPAATNVSMIGTLVNTGNVRLRDLDFRSIPSIHAEPTCYVRPVNSNSMDTVWKSPADVDVGHEVFCSISWPLAQDALEAATRDANGALAAPLVITAYANATESLQPVTAEYTLHLAVAHTPSMTLQVLDTGCVIPSDPGMRVEAGGLLVNTVWHRCEPHCGRCSLSLVCAD